MIDAGPVNYMAPTEDGEHVTEARSLDPTKLLVTAWEERVFPVIRRRFRSDSDRRSGLEQIRGALLAGKESHTLYSSHGYRLFITYHDALRTVCV